jgi:hypothetical protein
MPQLLPHLSAPSDDVALRNGSAPRVVAGEALALDLAAPQ